MLGSDDPNSPPEAGRQGIFNQVAPAILAMIGVMGLIQLLLIFAPSANSQRELILQLSFIPARFSNPDFIVALEGLGVPAVVTVLSHMFVHLSLGDFFYAAILLLIFGTPVAKRFGFLRFLLMIAGSTASGALLYFYLDPQSLWPMVGAMGAVNACVAAFARFGFESGGILSDIRVPFPLSCYIRARPLERLFSNRRSVIFIAVWVMLFIVVPFSLPQDAATVAPSLWYPRLAGFLFALLLFDLFDPLKGGGIDPATIEQEVKRQRAARQSRPPTGGKPDRHDPDEHHPDEPDKGPQS